MIEQRRQQQVVVVGVVMSDAFFEHGLEQCVSSVD
jgi:hypothetical protein